MLDVLHPQAPKASHKDKLAMTKQHDAEIHEALKAQQHAVKEKKLQDQAAVAKILKKERAYKLQQEPEQKHSKLAVREAREAAKKAEREEGATCEHGVHKCRICFPHKDNKELGHGHERVTVPSKFVEDDE